MRHTNWSQSPLQVKARRLGGIAIMTAASLALASQLGAAAQSTGNYNPPTYNRPSPNTDPLADTRPMSTPNPAKLEHMREDERHKRLVNDTTRLVELINELKAEVDKTSKDELSLDVVKKAAEIEKLAHDVKERMKS